MNPASMTAEQIERLKQDAIDTLQSIDIDKMAQKEYMLLGASLGIMAYAKRPAPVMPVMTAGDVLPTAPPQMTVVDYVQGSDIDEHLQRQIMNFVAYMNTRTEYQKAMTAENKTQLLNAFVMMMNTFEHTFESLRHGIMTAEEKERLKAFFDRQQKAIK